MRLNYPSRIVCEWNARNQLRELVGEVLGTTQPIPYLLVTGPSERYHALRDEFAASLGPAVAHFRDIAPEPELQHVDACLALLRGSPARMVVAVGGGSVIDVAKAAAALAPLEGTAREYFYGERKLTRKGLTFVAMPTTAGTGAEITKNSVLTDPATHIKQSIRHPSMTADIALCDPTLTLSLPPDITAFSGLDALTQAIEAYLTKSANPATRALAGKAVELIVPALPAAVRDGQDTNARLTLCQGSLLSAMSFSQSGLGAVHGLAHPIGSLLHIPHGKCCAVLLPYILRYNAPACDRRLNELSFILGLPGADAFCQAIDELCRTLAIPTDFAAEGLRSTHFPFILENCRSNSMQANPVHMPDEDVLALLERLTGTVR